MGGFMTGKVTYVREFVAKYHLYFIAGAFVAGFLL